MKGPKIIPVFLSQAGCPGQCIYCLREVVGAGQAVMSRSPEQEVAEACRLFPDGADEIAFYGGTFTLLEPTRQEAFLQAAATLRSRGFIQRIRLSTRPDTIDEETCRRLKAYGVNLIELGVQSLDPVVLKASGRGYAPACVEQSLRQLQAVGITVVFQLMLGLPEQHWPSVLQTTAETLRLRPAGVRIYPLLVFTGTPLYSLWQTGRYQALTLARAVAQASYWRRAFSDASIPVYRIGLQLASQELAKVAAGPWHASFSSLVKAHDGRRLLDCHLRMQTDDQLRRIMLGKAAALPVRQEKQRLEALLAQYPRISLGVHKAGAMLDSNAVLLS